MPASVPWSLYATNSDSPHPHPRVAHAHDAGSTQGAVPTPTLSPVFHLTAPCACPRCRQHAGGCAHALALCFFCLLIFLFQYAKTIYSNKFTKFHYQKIILPNCFCYFIKYCYNFCIHKTVKTISEFCNFFCPCSS